MNSENSKLPYAAGETTIQVLHLSGRAGLREIDPAYFGQGKASSKDRQGIPKSFFFKFGTILGADTAVFASSSYAYQATVPGGLLYDVRNGKDPLGWLIGNRSTNEMKLKKMGYLGIIARDQYERVSVVVFEKVKVEATVRSSLTHAR